LRSSGTRSIMMPGFARSLMLAPKACEPDMSHESSVADRWRKMFKDQADTLSSRAARSVCSRCMSSAHALSR
jgi:hypothetical protein